MKRIWIALVTAAALLALPAVAKAVPLYELTLSSGGTTIVTTDGSSGDLCPAAGCVTFSGAINTWTINVSTGLTAAGNPLIDLNSVNFGTGTLTITWSATDFSGPVPYFLSAIGGVLQSGGTLTYQAWVNSSNVLNGQTTPIGSLQTFVAGGTVPTPFSGSVSGGWAPTGLYSVTQQVVIAAGSLGSTSFNATVTAVPEPGSMLLLGTGLLGLAGAARRFRNSRTRA